MKKILFIISAILFIVSCNNSGKAKEEALTGSTDYEQVINKNIQPTTTLEFIESWKGKTAMEVGMFEDSILVKRLESLLGNEFQYFRDNWNVQTPIVKEDQVYSASGCKQNDCPSYYSIVYFDVKNNNINVLIKRGVHYKLFTENGEIPLSGEMKKNQSTIRANA